MGKVHKPQFEQFMHELQRGKPLDSKRVGEYRTAILGFLDGIPEILVNKASVTGHPEMRLDFKCSWLGPDWDQAEIIAALERRFPGGLFASEAREAHWTDVEEEVVVLRFGAALQDGYLAGRIRILPS